uniref:Glutaredoxin domain-containing protein n=1 Tax=Grammatophora oceanica TaxID=210454 RepID=A0A7S1V035_9STRA|mmetsp:Transcript_29587/g.43630  ORF Transcript_29587/g.43630 Transcript_29587/m.43630 type:complete len:227 (+) Transcript_29587:45-725(+)
MMQKIRLLHFVGNLWLCLVFQVVDGFNVAGVLSRQARTATRLHDMKRPLLDQLATTLFKLENARVEASSEEDEKGRVGEPMEWSESESMANKFSQVVASNPIGYRFKQLVADIVAGEFDKEAVEKEVNDFIVSGDVAMFSFTTCPFCRRAKDVLEEQGIQYVAMELDELDGNRGNEVRATLGRKTQRTSVPSIFVKGKSIGGCNDGTPGLIPLMESGKLSTMLRSQ